MRRDLIWPVSSIEAFRYGISSLWYVVGKRYGLIKPGAKLSDVIREARESGTIPKSPPKLSELLAKKKKSP